MTTEKLNIENRDKAVAIATDLVVVPQEHSLGCTIDKADLEVVLDHYEISYPDGSLLHAMLLGRIFSSTDCTFERFSKIAHFFYHVFQGEDMDLREILEGLEDDEVHYAEGNDTVH